MTPTDVSIIISIFGGATLMAGSVWHLASKIGQISQQVADHSQRIRRIEDLQDRTIRIMKSRSTR